MSGLDDYDLFRIVDRTNSVTDATEWRVEVHGIAVSDWSRDYNDAARLWRTLVNKTAALDGHARAFAIAWSMSMQAQDNLTAVQQRSSELIQESRARKRALDEAKAQLETHKNTIADVKAKLYDAKFALEQGTSPAAIIETIIELLDETRSTKEVTT